MEVLAFGTEKMLNRPCVDYGTRTGRFCDYCRAKDRLPMERWAHNQATPLCSVCDNKYDTCRFCRADVIAGTPSGQAQATQGGGGDQERAPKEVGNQTERGPDEAFETKNGRRVYGPAPPPGLLEELEAEQRLNKAKSPIG